MILLKYGFILSFWAVVISLCVKMFDLCETSFQTFVIGLLVLAYARIGNTKTSLFVSSLVSRFEARIASHRAAPSENLTSTKDDWDTLKFTGINFCGDVLLSLLALIRLWHAAFGGS